MNSAQLVQVLKVLFPSAMQGNEGYTLSVDGSGNASILLWNNALGTQPTTAQLTAELASLQLQQAQSTQITALASAYAAAVASPVPYMSTTFLNDPPHQQLLSRAAQAYTLAGAVPNEFFVPDANMNEVAMTLTQLQGLVAAIAAQEWTAFTQWVSLQKQVAAATTMAAVQAVVW